MKEKINSTTSEKEKSTTPLKKMHQMMRSGESPDVNSSDMEKNLAKILKKSASGFRNRISQI